jgi:two-component system, chemotaxis family, response regulator Rcp1
MMTEEKGRIQVFMVDDNPDDIELTLEAFRETKSEHGFSFDVAQDGVEAMGYLRREGEFKDRPTPDLILLDLNMPRMNGFEVLEELKKDYELKNIPVVVLSISQSKDDMAKVSALNANSYIVKPMNIDDYVNVVRKIEAIVMGSFFGSNG